MLILDTTPINNNYCGEFKLKCFYLRQKGIALFIHSMTADHIE